MQVVMMEALCWSVKEGNEKSHIIILNANIGFLQS